MGKWLLKMGLAAVCCAAAPATAEMYGSLDALYWKAEHSPILVARRVIGGGASGDSPMDAHPVSLEDFTHQEETFSKGTFDLGGRLRLGYSSCECNWFIEGSFLSWKATESTSVSRVPYGAIYWYGFPPYGYPGGGSYRFELSHTVELVQDDVELRYNNLYGRVGRELRSTCNSSLRTYAQLSWTSIDFKNNLTVVVPAESAVRSRFANVGENELPYYRQYADFRGAGFGFGLAGDYHLCAGWSIAGAAGLDLLYGSSDITEAFALANILFIAGISKASLLNNGQSWDHFVPSCNFRVSVNYSLCWLSAELGWEMHYYANVMRFTSDNIVPALPGSGNLMSTETQDLSFGGPYLSVGSRF